jgi:two-component SAPR family response regulator
VLGGRTSLPAMLTEAGGRRLWVSASRYRPDGSQIVFRTRTADPEYAADHVSEAPGRSNRLRLFTLGSFDVQTSSGPAVDRNWLDQRPGRLLKYLVAQRGRPVAADEIAEALWPRTARHDTGAVRHAVHLLRRRVASDYILTTSGRYALDLTRVWIDADAFETGVRTGLQAFVTGDLDLTEPSLQRALALYRGDFLLENAYDEWALDERDRLRTLLEVPLRVLAELRLRQGDDAGAAGYIQRLARSEPFDADVHRLLVTVWLRQGLHTRALRHYERFKARLMRDFGVRPDFDVAGCQRRLGEPLHAL